MNFLSFMTGVLLTSLFLQAHAQQHKIPVGWRSMGAMPSPTWDGNSLLFSSDGMKLTVTAISDEIIRIRCAPEPFFGRKQSYAVAPHDLKEAFVRIEIHSQSTRMQTRLLRIDIQHDPLRISIADQHGEMLDADDPQRGISWCDCSFRIAKRLQMDEHVYGFGQKNGRLDKRGWQLGGYHYTMWNCDTYRFDASTDPTYVSVPFYIAMRQGKAHGIFLDNTWRSTFDIGRERQDLLTFGAEGGELDYYFIYGPHPKQVLEQYTALTGRTPLPPIWSLGYHQCRWSYYPESRVRLLASIFRNKQIPIDALWLDIHYQDQYKPFTWDASRFPNPKAMISDLKAQGIRTVCIIDPHPTVEKGYEPYDTGIRDDHFVKWPNGTVFEGPVWPSLADRNPNLSVFPDFTRAATRHWWGTLHKSLLDIGVAGIWNDMNEPSVFIHPTGTMPLELIHDHEGHPTSHREIHNVYGQLMTRSTFEGWQALQPNERPFILTRSTFAGGQRYAAVWNGDSAADWATLRQSVSTLLGMGLSGFPFVGSDIGGFSKHPSAELFTRWLQVGVFSPFMRVHAEFDAPEKEPWVYGHRYESILKHTIELRYRLLPYLYDLMHRASCTGEPPMRPLCFEFPQDEHTYSLDDQFLFGPDLLIAPILWEGAHERKVYLPSGIWYNFTTKRKFQGGKTIAVRADIDEIPIFVREGAFLLMQPVVQHTGEMSGARQEILIFPGAQSQREFYEDDGATLAYQKGVFLKRQFVQTRCEEETRISISAAQGSYRPAERSLVLRIVSDQNPASSPCAYL